MIPIPISQKHNWCYVVFKPFHGARPGLWRRCGPLFGAKSVEGTLEGLETLQAFEIPQNRQRNLWKSLEKNSLVLEKLAKKLGGRSRDGRSALRLISRAPHTGLSPQGRGEETAAPVLRPE